MLGLFTPIDQFKSVIMGFFGLVQPEKRGQRNWTSGERPADVNHTTLGTYRTLKHWRTEIQGTWDMDDWISNCFINRAYGLARFSNY